MQCLNTIWRFSRRPLCVSKYVETVLVTIPTTAPNSSNTGPPLEPFAKSAVIASIVTGSIPRRRLFTNCRDTRPSLNVKKLLSGLLMTRTSIPAGAFVESGSGVKPVPSACKIATSASRRAASTAVTGAMRPSPVMMSITSLVF